MKSMILLYLWLRHRWRAWKNRPPKRVGSSQSPFTITPLCPRCGGLTPCAWHHRDLWPEP